MKDSEIEKLLITNEIIALQTDTVYGFFISVNKENMKKINLLKNRDSYQKLQVFFNNFNQIKKWTKLSPWQEDIIKKNLPGNISYVVEANTIGKDATGLDTIQIRWPKKEESPLTHKIIDKIGPLFASSANVHNEDIYDNCKDIINKFNISCLSYSRFKKNNQPSKIYSLLDDTEKRIR